MFGNNKDQVYKILKENVGGDCFEILKKVFDDLGSVDVNETVLENHYKRNFGKKYKDVDEGFSKYIINFVNTSSSVFSKNDFNFSYDEYVRSVIFYLLRPFIKKHVDIDKSFNEVCSNEITLYYLQQNNIELSEQEYFFILGHYSDIEELYNGIRKICSVSSINVGTDKNEKENELEEKSVVENEENEEEENTKKNLSKEEEAEASFEELFGE